MRVFKTRVMQRFADGERIADVALMEAIDRAARGLIDADLGGGLIKQRIARPGAGKRGGFRVLIGYRDGGRAVFLYGFAKNELENIGKIKQAELREIGAAWLNATSDIIAHALETGQITEVDHD